MCIYIYYKNNNYDYYYLARVGQRVRQALQVAQAGVGGSAGLAVYVDDGEPRA